MPRGRIPKAARREVRKAFEKFIDENEYPLVAKFCSSDETARKYWVNKNDIGDWKEFRPLTERALLKQEAYLVTRGMTSNQQTTMSIFLLKQPQIGYRDRVEQDITTGGSKITFTNSVPRPETKQDKKGKK